MSYLCEQCGSSVKNRNARRFCALKCYHIFMVGKPSSRKGMSQKAWNKGVEMPEMRGNNHHAWKGDDVSYRNLHKWVERRLGKPNRCEECKSKTPPDGKGIIRNYFQWANVSGLYKRTLSDWKMLCYKCHKAFDKIKV